MNFKSQYAKYWPYYLGIMYYESKILISDDDKPVNNSNCDMSNFQK